MRVYTLCTELCNIFELEQKIKLRDELNPIQFHVLLCVALDGWFSEEQIYIRFRNHADQFRRVSERKIIESLLELCRLGFVKKEDIETDLEEDFVTPTQINVTPLNGPNGCGVFS